MCSSMRGGPAVRQREVVEKVDGGTGSVPGLSGVLEALSVRAGVPV